MSTAEVPPVGAAFAGAAGFLQRTSPFNAALLGELRAVAFVKRLIAEGRMPRGAMKDLNIHLIADEVLMNELGASSKLRPRPGLLTRLKAAGRVAAEGWLKDHAGAVGRESSVDLRVLFG